jgi:hypothetical protein
LFMVCAASRWWCMFCFQFQITLYL